MLNNIRIPSLSEISMCGEARSAQDPNQKLLLAEVLQASTVGWRLSKTTICRILAMITMAHFNMYTFKAMV